jgi:glycosyltransferase involved in cell wall biosynthesis
MTEITVIVPTHNRPHLLEITLRSIVAQRSVDLEVTVVDDGSKDARPVPAVIDALRDSRVRLVRHETPRGVSAARNTGIANSSSEWIGFCDDDDVWAPEKLRAQLAAARSSSAGWAYTGDVAIDEALRVLSGASPLPPVELVSALEHYNPVPAGSSNVVVRRSVLDVVGLFDPMLRSVGDWDLWVRLARHGLPACVPEPYVGCRVHVNTITRNRELMLAEVDLVAARHHLPVDRARHYRWAAWNSLLERRRFEAVGYYARAIRLGDLASIGRSAMALIYPGIASRRQARPPENWARAAQVWLDALRPTSADTGHADDHTPQPSPRK